jgi:RimJ/RimL family protein N-acetyltransferase
MINLPLSPDYPIVTDRLLLRPLTDADREDLLAYRSDPETCRYLPFPPMDEAEIDRRMREQWTRIEIDAEGQSLTLGIELRATGALVGDVILFVHSATNASGELGYVISPSQVGNGYASEAAAEMLRVGFRDVGLHRIVGRLDARNAASARVLERIGMRREALLREAEGFKGEWSDTLIYAKLEGD